MKNLMTLAVAALLLTGAISAQAGEDMKGGLGFHYGESPTASISSLINPVGTQASKGAAMVGVRQWFSGQVGVDLGVGMSSQKVEQGTQSETWTSFSFDLGLPIVLKKFDRVNFILRPGFQYSSIEDKDESVVPADVVKFTSTGISGTLEAEWMVADNLSISAAHGVAWGTIKSDTTPEFKLTSFGTTGSNFTQLGFNIYLW